MKKVTISPYGPLVVKDAVMGFPCDVTVDGEKVADLLVPGQDIVLEDHETVLERVARRAGRNALHFRIVYPKDYRGVMHAGNNARIYVTFPGEEERPLPKTVNVKADWPVDGVVSVQVTFAGTVEVEYRDEP